MRNTKLLIKRGDMVCAGWQVQRVEWIQLAELLYSRELPKEDWE